jgi:hypothetical protein
MWRKIQEVHPTLAESGKFMDWEKYRLGRLQSEMRTESKKLGMKNRKQGWWIAWGRGVSLGDRRSAEDSGDYETARIG